MPGSATLEDTLDLRLALQPDIYERYAFLARLTTALAARRSEPIHVLDVGSGPGRFTELFLGPAFQVARADVDQFGDPDILLLTRGQPLPFASGSFDLVLALEVLEHLPKVSRPDLIRELQRVSRGATIVCCPVGTADTVEAEARFSAWAFAIAGRSIEFLDEHRQFGLPGVAELSACFARPSELLIVDNAPLAEWLAFNLLDFIYACDWGDTEEKHRLNRGINAGAPFRRLGVPCYRRFFCAIDDAGTAAAVGRAIAEPSASAKVGGLTLIPNVMAAVLTLRDDLRSRRETELAAQDVSIGQLEQLVGALRAETETARGVLQTKDATLEERAREALSLRAAVDERDTQLEQFTRQTASLVAEVELLRAATEVKDAHIGSLDATLLDLTQGLAQKEAQVAAQTTVIHSLNAAVAQHAVDARRAADQISNLEDDLVRSGAANQRAIDALHARDAALTTSNASVSVLTAELAAAHRSLQAILSSRAWRATAPVRALGGTKRRLTRLGRRSSRWLKTVARAGRLRSGGRGAFDPSIDVQGLFDAAFYRESNPDVVAAGADPLAHYLTVGAAEGRDPHPMFDSSFYLERNPDVRAAGANPLIHYVVAGAAEQRSPHPLFDPSFYLANNPDAAAARMNPLVHYAAGGVLGGRDPHPLFDGNFYLRRYADVASAGVNPLAHYLTAGASERRDPHPLFDTSFYVEHNPDVAAAGTNSLAHYLSDGALEGRDPHPLFDSSFYLERNPDVAAAGANPLAHYLEAGAAERRDPHPLFDTSFYLDLNPDVAAAGINPLVHYLAGGAAEGRDPHPEFDSSFYLASNPDVAADALNPLVHYVLSGRREGRASHPRRPETFYVPPQGLLPWFNPLNLEVSPQLSSAPRLNVLLPGLAMRHLSGGPNTALALAGRLACEGIRVRLINTDAPPDDSLDLFRSHMRRLLGRDLPPDLEIATAHDRWLPAPIGDRDIFMATAWWTAQQAKYAVKLTRHQTFVYLIQDYEPLLHAASTAQALASETYGLEHIPVVNSSYLHEFLVQQRIGRFAEPAFAAAAMVFEPAVDTGLFHPVAVERPPGRRRLLFYARPTNGLRNLFELGVAALQKAVADGILQPDEWSFVGMGEPFQPVALGAGATLVPAPWRDLSGYAAQMRESDILLSLMLSPHPSYPPLEMAASAGLVVTTAFATKTADRLQQLSANIIATEPTVEGVTNGLARARAMTPDWPQRLAAAHVDLPRTWDDSFADVLPSLVDRLLALQGSPVVPPSSASPPLTSEPRIHPSYRAWPRDESDLLRGRQLQRRAHAYPTIERPGLLSFLTPVWNTDPRQLEELAQSVLGQDLGSNYEWVVLDNGSDRADTRAVIERLTRDPRVRLHRSDTNLGIIAGTRFCLDHAAGRYAATVDHDDLLTPDCVRVLTHALVEAGYPPLAYTDEEKLDGRNHRDSYFKPDWDPVLFTASCYIAHLIVFDRALAHELGAYTDPQAEGSHDWDTFMRFALRGLVPLHVPEVLYSWRIHAQSTAGDIHAKPYVSSSQRCVLEKFIASAAHPHLYRIEPSPLFSGTPDWRIRRGRIDPAPFLTVVLGDADAPIPSVSVDPAISHTLIDGREEHGFALLRAAVARCVAERRLVHLVWTGMRIEESEWPWDAMAQFELFPDTAVVGGRIVRDGRLLSAGSYFGFGRGCDTPDRGRAVGDPGYFVQMWKPHSTSAVPVQHCVVDPAFFDEWLSGWTQPQLPIRQLGAWLGAFARVRGRRVVYSPFLIASGSARSDVEGAHDPLEWAVFRRVHAALLPDTRCLSIRLGLDSTTAYRAVSDETRRHQLGAAEEVGHATALAADRIARSLLLPVGLRRTTFSILTSVYARSPAALLDLAAASTMSQRRPFDQWVLVVDGPVPPDLDGVITRLAADARITVIREPANVGIVRAMRRALLGATGDHVVPMDGDDLLEPDTLELFETALAAADPDFLYGDEAIRSGDDIVARFSRPPFDPVLNLETSYVWHPCVFRRVRAIELGVYSDPRTEFCHDWDTVHRFAGAGAAIAHLPHVLYHWRTHANSVSHSGAQHAGSISSSRHLLGTVVARQSQPELYDVQTFPIFRGAEEWYVARRHEQGPVVDLFVQSPVPSGIAEVFPFRRTIRMAGGRGWSETLRELAAQIDSTSPYCALVSDVAQPIGGDWVWEAIRLLELHQQVGVVSGRTVDPRGIVVDTGRRLAEWSRPLNDFAGLHRSDPGPFALALKPHSIDEPGEAIIVAEVAVLEAAIQLAREAIPLRFGQLIAAAAVSQRRTIAYSPLLEAVTRRPN